MAPKDPLSDPSEDPSQGPSGPGKHLASGFEVAAGVGLGAAIGLWIDRHHHTQPWGLLIGICLGFAAGIYLLIKEAMRSNKD